MRLTPLVKKALVGSAFAGALFIGAPQAQAEEAPSSAPITVAPATSYVEQVRAELIQRGIAAPVVPQEISRVVDDTINAVMTQQVPTTAIPTFEVPQVAVPSPLPTGVQVGGKPAVALYDQQAPATNPEPMGLETMTQPEFRPVTVDPNYMWHNDMFSKVAAAKPFADYVLHRAPGSYFDAPRVPEESNRAMSQGKSLYGPGTPIYVNNNTMCTLTLAGIDAQGRKVGLTAGHCAKVGDTVASADSWQVGNSGTVVSKNAELDYALIEFGSNAEVTPSYNGVTAAGIGGKLPTTGESVCKRGVATGTTCGMTFTTGPAMQFNHLCATVGDSGAPVFYRGKVVGSVSGGYTPLGVGLSCITPLQGPIHVPTITANTDAVLNDINQRGGVGAGFRLGRA
ncbi:MAG: S1 family peptidase [Corynebacterium sp.]|nr:S1 family peptidase [Corynebacterium sp.]